MNYILSILIPSIPERLTNLQAKIAEYEALIDKYGLNGKVEIVSVCDNKTRSIGQKRTDLIRLSQGRYVVMTDDDADRLTRRYFENIEEAIAHDPDVITYFQFARINDDYTFVSFGLRNPSDYQVHIGVTRRPAWHCCTWRRAVVEDIKFGDKNWGEDHEWAMAANELAETEHHIADICHVYEHDSEKTAAFL
jgi:hypothetical protein